MCLPIQRFKNFFPFQTFFKKCKILGFRGGEYEEYRLLGCYTVSLVRTDVSEGRIASIIRVTKICELGTFAVTNNRSTMRRNTNYYLKYLVYSIFHSVLRLLVIANVVPSSPILVALMMKAIRSSETSVLTRATQRHIQEDGILHSHRCDDLKSYIIEDSLEKGKRLVVNIWT
jgi:hypothetical protein